MAISKKLLRAELDRLIKESVSLSDGLGEMSSYVDPESDDMPILWKASEDVGKLTGLLKDMRTRLTE